MSLALLFMLLLSGLGIGGNIFSDAIADIPICPGETCSCPHGWTPYDRRCYLFTSQETTWNNAEENCVSFDAHLTSLRGMDQYNFIRKLINDATGTNTRTWVGGTNIDGDWKWIDGSPFTFPNWGNWGPGEPNNAGGNEHCMDINLGGQDYINDENCDTKNAFVCAKDA